MKNQVAKPNIVITYEIGDIVLVKYLQNRRWLFVGQITGFNMDPITKVRFATIKPLKTYATEKLNLSEIESVRLSNIVAKAAYKKGNK